MPEPAIVAYAVPSALLTHLTYERALMRLTIAIWGHELDLTIGPATTEDEPDQGAALNGGTCASTPFTFTAMPVPQDVAMPQRTAPWDEPDDAPEIPTRRYRGKG